MATRSSKGRPPERSTPRVPGSNSIPFYDLEWPPEERLPASRQCRSEAIKTSHVSVESDPRDGRCRPSRPGRGIAPRVFGSGGSLTAQVRMENPLEHRHCEHLDRIVANCSLRTPHSFQVPTGIHQCAPLPLWFGRTPAPRRLGIPFAAAFISASRINRIARNSGGCPTGRKSTGTPHSGACSSIRARKHPGRAGRPGAHDMLSHR